jgi:hypothetical protein
MLVLKIFDRVLLNPAFNRATRKWQPINEVWLNLPKEHINEAINLKPAA